MMKRRQLFEFNDLPGYPVIFRKLFTGIMQTVMGLLMPFKPKLDLIARVIEASESDHVVDLCSGSGGPWLQLSGPLEERLGHRLHIRLTDKFPDSELATGENLPDNITYYQGPVDARSVPDSLTGCRTLFNGFHHFPPEDATRILRDTVLQQRGIIIMECLVRSRIAVFTALFTPVFVCILTPLVRPFRWMNLVFTYLLPIFPLLVTWDSIVSFLRCYTPDELLAMANRADPAMDFEWHAGSYRFYGGHTYLMGYPKNAAATDETDG